MQNPKQIQNKQTKLGPPQASARQNSGTLPWCEGHRLIGHSFLVPKCQDISPKIHWRRFQVDCIDFNAINATPHPRKHDEISPIILILFSELYKFYPSSWSIIIIFF